MNEKEKIATLENQVEILKNTVETLKNVNQIYLNTISYAVEIIDIETKKD
jgi:CII-binding regulator of phage lambda lysogenization HflD